jgi:hypothetical protein
VTEDRCLIQQRTQNAQARNARTQKAAENSKKTNQGLCRLEDGLSRSARHGGTTPLQFSAFFCVRPRSDRLRILRPPLELRDQV